MQTSSKVVARAREAVFRTRIVQEDPVLNQTPTLSQFESRFLSYKELRVDEATFKAYRNSWAVIRNFRDVPLNEVTPLYIEEFIQTQFEAEKEVSTVNLYLAGLKCGLNVAKSLGIILSVPEVKHVPGENKRKYVFSPEVEARFVAIGDPEMTQALVFAIETGLRRHEICDLLKTDWKDGKITVREGKTEGSAASVPLTNRAIAILEKLKARWHPEVPYIFTLQDGMNAMYPDFLSHKFRDARAALGITDPDCVFHSARHTFCTRLGNKGANSTEIMKLARHSNIATSARYTHPDDEQLARVIERMNK